MHVGQVNSTEDPGRTHTLRHACKSCIQQMHYSTAGRTVLRDDRGLGARVDKCLNGRLVHRDVNIKHTNLTEEFRELLLGRHVVLLDKVLLDLFFDELLSLGVVRIRIHELGFALLLFPLRLHISLQFFLNDLFDFILVSRLKRSRQLRIVILEERSLVKVAVPDLADGGRLAPYLLRQLIMVKLVEHLIEVHLGSARYVTLERREEVVEQVLIGLVQLLAASTSTNHTSLFSKHEHIVVADAVLGQPLRIGRELIVFKEDGLVADGYLRLDLKQALEVLHGHIDFDVEIVKDVFLRQILHEQGHGRGQRACLQ